MKKGKLVKTRIKATKTKRKQWKKGQSCVTNPVANAHRKAAKSRFFQVESGPSNLTVEALAEHNAEQNEQSTPMDAMSDGQTIGAKSFATWATNWTDCTNATFSRVLRYSGSSLHKEILAVLAAITEIIKERNGKETETEYFAALMTALDTMEGEETISAVAYLLSLAIRKVPQAVLRRKFSDVSKAIVSAIATHTQTASAGLLRALIRCLAHSLQVQDISVWSASSTTNTYNALLSLIAHPKPKVSSGFIHFPPAHDAIRIILRGSSFVQESLHHPAASVTAKFCIREIEQCGGLDEDSTALHYISLLKLILPCFPHNALKSTCETLLKLMTLSNVVVTASCMKTFYCLFTSLPSSSSLPPALNAQIITALYDYQPNETDVQPMSAWLAVMEEAHSNLARLDSKLCSAHLPKIFSAAMKCMRSERRLIATAAAKTLTILLKQCVAPSIDDLKNELSAAPSGVSVISKIIVALEGGLSYQCHAVWDQVLQVLQAMFEVIGGAFAPLLTKCLLSLVDLRDSHRFAFTAELDKCVGMATRSMGPKQFLKAVPLQITGEGDDYNFPRGWLLPVMRDHIQETELGFFADYFLPLAVKLHQAAEINKGKNQMVLAKTYDILQMQIWSLLPGFCTRPTDLLVSFKKLARVLGSAVQERMDIQSDILASIRKLVNQNLENEEHKKELSKFSKNFLPIFFNLYSADNGRGERDGTRLALLETIKCYFQVTSDALMDSFMNNCLNKVKEEKSSFKKHALLDLLIVMVKYASSERLQQLFAMAAEDIKSSDKTIQKKSYRILEEICSSASASAQQFIDSNLDAIQEHLLDSLSTLSPASKAPRLKCLIHVFRRLQDSRINFLATVAPEAILCCKNAGERATSAALGLLIEMGRAIVRWNDDENKSKSECVGEYISLISAGLAGSTHMVSCSVAALTCVLHEFRSDLDSEILKDIVQATCLLLRSKSKLIVESSLSLTKSLLVIVDKDLIAQFLKDLVSSMAALKDENHVNVRTKPKIIFTRLVRHYGYEVILSMTPKSHHAMLSNIRKAQQKAKNKKEKIGKEEEEEDGDFSGGAAKGESIEDILHDSDSEMEDDTDDKRNKRPQKKKATRAKEGATWLKEGGTDEGIIDFLDPSVSKRVLASKPLTEREMGRSSSVKHNFKTAADGRFIITDDPSDDEGGAKGGDDVIDDVDELMDAMGHYSKKARKRKLSDSNDAVDDEDAPNRYQAGGKGIHRKLKNEAPEPGAEYRAKKAKGDMKKKGKMDPFAYIPFDQQFLNKRKQAKVKGKFKNLVKGAQKGATSGKKMKARRK
ncbi:hypothetical protein CAPTEDRAFT_226490 [Capitella teleta]|uniref:Uncharacterized protein n=1 Tax=Capitella teleta TaxID=283909 RepID=R7UBV9_CAPTE|nr:hypothetical protein CAPTEDRAFT_226490 [Capitella teleta]|eukprot:ELU03860.1 hypothetical protein CAPTEDRAFT_226490 [Capitella teleta]